MGLTGEEIARAALTLGWDFASEELAHVRGEPRRLVLGNEGVGVGDLHEVALWQ